MRLPYLLIGAFLLALCMGAVSAETYVFEGATSTGQYSGTLVVANDGSSALSLAAVSEGTMSSGPLGAPAPVPTTIPLVSQDILFDVQDGQGFAGCSVIGASGDKASTATLVSGTSAGVSQEAGTFDTSLFGVSLAGAYAGQEVYSGPVGAFSIPLSNSFIKSASAATSSSGDHAFIQVNTSGVLDLFQGAAAGSVVAPFDPLYVGVNGAIAGQMGDAGSIPPESGNYQISGDGKVDASGTASDAQGNTASTGTQVENGYLSFFQIVGAGTIDAAYDFFGVGPSEGVLGVNVSGAFAAQDVYGETAGSSVSSVSSATSAEGNSASARLRTDGSFEYTQGALAGAASAGFNTSSAGIDCALAGQGGSFETSSDGHGMISSRAADSNGNSVFTDTGVENGYLDFIQIVGAGNADVELDADLLGIPGNGPQVTGSGAFGIQAVEGESSDGMLMSLTEGSAGDNVAIVGAGSTGNSTGRLAQVAVAGDVNVDTGLPTMDDILVNGALAGQIGKFQNTTASGSTNSIAAGFGADSQDDMAIVFSEVENGTLGFAQLVLAGSIDAGQPGNLTAALALQASNVNGTAGRVFANTQNAAGDESSVNVSFSNNKNKVGWISSASAAGAGTVNSPLLIGEIGSDSISGTGAGLWEFERDGITQQYSMNAYANLEGLLPDNATRTGKVNLHDAYAYTGLGGRDAEVGNH